MRFRVTRRPKLTAVLTIRHRDHTGMRGVATVIKGHTPRRYDRLEVISASTGARPVELKVYINARSYAATLRLHEGRFREKDILHVEDVTMEPTDE